MSIAVRLIGAIPLIVLGLLLVGGLLRKMKKPRKGGPILHLQRVSSVAELEQLVGDLNDARRDSQRTALSVDFAFIAGYLTLFVTFAVLLAFRDAGWATWLAVAAALTATIAALFDVRENLATLRVLKKPIADTTSPMLAAIRSNALIKWAFVAITIALLTGLFWGEDRSDLTVAFGVAWAIAAAIGVVAIVQPTLLDAFFVADAAVVLATLILFVAAPSTFSQGF